MSNYRNLLVPASCHCSRMVSLLWEYAVLDGEYGLGGERLDNVDVGRALNYLEGGAQKGSIKVFSSEYEDCEGSRKSLKGIRRPDGIDVTAESP